MDELAELKKYLAFCSRHLIDYTDEELDDLAERCEAVSRLIRGYQASPMSYVDALLRREVEEQFPLF